ncbi:hypothetical protein USDA257_c31970 [Sinorhizobium fredii USDA 257]|uniref:Uncharacterized protein n=1 Tax=Sinorhizobium fredii (strain USDA 257) TaxID=1185652 RepID=I3X7A9_SINF2|nr:hypothetical protein USDA257_c19510 [Sinorhizobium fredii USDA 257]AFL51765.1 hypothetical protein USDA257_c31970 [Sinorhizobium fredii USDA 257]
MRPLLTERGHTAANGQMSAILTESGIRIFLLCLPRLDD